jgi:hypothetical protein
MDYQILKAHGLVGLDRWINSSLLQHHHRIEFEHGRGHEKFFSMESKMDYEMSEFVLPRRSKK